MYRFCFLDELHKALRGESDVITMSPMNPADRRAVEEIEILTGGRCPIIFGVSSEDTPDYLRRHPSLLAMVRATDSDYMHIHVRDPHPEISEEPVIDQTDFLVLIDDSFTASEKLLFLALTLAEKKSWVCSVTGLRTCVEQWTHQDEANREKFEEFVAQPEVAYIVRDPKGYLERRGRVLKLF